MRITLHTEVAIDSAHKLEDYDGQCKNLHGHTWFVEIWFKGDTKDVDKVGILVDFSIVKELKDTLDHKYLNDILKVNPTAENLTEWIYLTLKAKINNPKIKTKVRVYETYVGKKTYCEGGDW